MNKYTIEINGCELVEVETDLDLYSDDETVPSDFNDKILKAYKEEYGEEYYEIIRYWKPKSCRKIETELTKWKE